MKGKLPPNKGEKFQEDLYFKQQEHKDKERRKLTASLYKERPIPRTRRGQRKK